METLEHEIPDDIFIEILLRVAVPAIPRFRALSKFYRALIDSPDFIRQHCRLAANRSSSLRTFCCEAKGKFGWMEFEAADSMAKIDRPVDFFGHPDLNDLTYDPSDNLIGSCMGILCFSFCCVLDRRTVILFWNPSTQRHRELIVEQDDDYIGLDHLQQDDKDIDLDHLRQNYFVGYDSVTEDIKLLNRCGSEHYVYSCRTGSWKHIQGFHSRWPNLRYYCHRYHRSEYVFVEGTNCVHTLALDSELFKIVAFDFSTESFSLTPLPPGVCFTWRNYFPFRQASLCGCLCLCSVTKETPAAPFEVWMMKEYGVEESWAKILSINPLSTSPSRSYFMTLLDLMSDGRQLLFWLYSPMNPEENGLYIYDEDDKTQKKVSCKGIQFSKEPRCYPFNSSLRLP